MTDHARILRDLYDYLRNDLPPDGMEHVRRHLENCPRCAQACEDLRATFHQLEPLGQSPAEDLPESYWEGFLERTMAGVLASPARPAPARRSWWDDLVALATERRRWILATGGTAVAVGVILLVGSPRPGTPGPAPALVTPAASDSEVESYLRQSQALLVSLTNATPEEEPPSDLDLERAMSRELLNRGRSLDGETLDPRSARVVADLNRVFLELANLDPGAEAPEVHIVLDGIRERNLLFRVRMAKAVRDSVRMLQASMMNEGE